MSDSVDLIRQHLEINLPPGIFWTPQNDFSLLLDAIAERLAEYYDYAVSAADIRDPEGSRRLMDLANEYAAEYYSNTTTDEIIALVKVSQAGVTEPGAGDLQKALNDAGFDVQVHRNGPTATNPANFIGDAIPQMVAGNETAVAGNENANAGLIPGADVLINGLIQGEVPIVASGAGVEFMVAGNEQAVAGYYETVDIIEYDYELPTDSDVWNQVYFIGGDATRSVDGELTDIEYVDIPQTKQNQFEAIILKYGPADGWTGLCINYV